jgi:hypothetical protein
MIDFGASQPVNALGLFQQGMSARRQFDARDAYAKLAANPEDKQALARLRAADPETALHFEGQQREARSRELAVRAASGDQEAFHELAGLDPATWAKIGTEQREQIKQQNATIGQLAYAADTPEKWAVAVHQAKAMGLDVTGYEDFGQRNAVLAHAGMLDDWIKSQEPKYIPVGENGVVNTRDPAALAAVAADHAQAAGAVPADDLEAHAAEAIAAGADPAAVRARLAQMRGGASQGGSPTFP